MASEPSPSNPTTSFSAARRWGIFLSVIISIVAVIALVVMINYLGARYYLRFPLSRQTEVKLSPQTLFLLKTVTNEVKVIVYYDKSDNLYTHVKSWLDEYQNNNPKITIQTVDYLRDTALAQQIKNTYKLGTSEDKNLVIFDCNGRSKIVPEGLLADYQLEELPSEKEREFERRLKGFNGEMRFTPALLSVISPKQRKVYFLEGHREHRFDEHGNDGYEKFAALLEQNNVTNVALNLSGTNIVPSDCNLLIIAGPRKTIPRDELAKIKLYLDQGGKLFVLFHFYTSQTRTGLENLLADWNIDVGMNVVDDPDNRTGSALAVGFWNKNHPVSSPMLASKYVLNMIYPRSIGVLNKNKQGPETPTVEELAFTGPKATVGNLGDNTRKPAGSNVSLIAAAEKSSAKGVLQEHGSTAILAVGDSYFLSNEAIEMQDNSEFVGYAINWLLDQTEMLQGVGPHPVKEYKLVMTQAQVSSVTWLFLAIMPGGILAFGGLVWLRRRR